MSTNNPHVAKFKAQLEEWSAKLDQLKARARQASAEARIEYDRKVEAFRSKVEEAKARQSELQEAGGDAWQRLTDGVDAAWNEVKTAYQDGKKS